MMSLSYHFVGFLCRKQKHLSRSRPSSREDGSIAKVIRSQFLYPTAHPGRRTTNSSFANRQQKSMSSLMSCRQDRSNFTCSKSRKFHTTLANPFPWRLAAWNSICNDSQTITNMEPSGLLGHVMELMPFSFSQHISAVSLIILTVLLKNSSFVFSRSFGIAPW
jgi:hypothetical protein